MADPPLHSGTGSTPIPDPTLLTTQQLTREIAALREILDAKIDGLKVLFEARFDANETAVRLHQERFDRIPTQIDEKVNHLAKLVEEKFVGVERSFQERDVRVKESATATATAVAAALQAAKEAVGEQNKSFTVSIDKSEKATSEQINQLRGTIDATAKGVDGKIDDIKDRLTRIESVAVGRVETVTEHRAGAADQRGTIALGISIGVAVLTLIGFVLTLRPG